MKKILVSLISEQTIPNILAIHHFKPDELLFMSTKKMEDNNKTSAILNTLDRLGIEYKSYTIVVQEDSILDCHKQINDWINGKEDAEFVVNLTCGTKIMSIAAYEYFKDYSSKMIYIPIPRNEFIVPFPKKSPGKPTSFDLKLNVIQYLTACGLEIVNEPKLKNYSEAAIKRKDLSEWIVKNYSDITILLDWFYENLKEYRNENNFYFEGNFRVTTQSAATCLSKLGFTSTDNAVSKKLERSEIKYLTGGWLEEFCFNTAIKWLGLGVDSVVIGLQLKDRHGRDNEFDVMFTKDNALYFIECKSLDQPQDKDASNALYKVGALQKEFGLRVESFFVTTFPYIVKNGKVRESIQARAEQFKTMVVPPSDIDKFGDIIAHKLNVPIMHTHN